MEWADEAIVLAVRRHGESAAIASLLTRTHGRHAGLVPGGTGRTMRPVLQPGNQVAAQWRGRLPEQLGHWKLELTGAHAARVLDDAARLDALSAACALCETMLPEREPHPAVHAALAALLTALAAESWPSVYVHWELALLRDLGFGLDLTACAATGATEGLAFVSPKSGRAVSAQAGAPWASRLLPLPGFLTGGGEGGRAQIHAGLTLTGHFLERHLPQGLPPPRQRLIDRFAP